MKWDENIPDTTQWKPREDAKERLSRLFYKRCREVEARILSRAKAEQETRIDNFDSGAGIEDIIRDELSNLLPRRYSVRAGVLGDRYGKTAGDCDVIVFNDFWFPVVHSGATEVSRKFHFPVEGAYAVGEIKSLLDHKTLDEALRKLVACHRLHRAITESDRVVENMRIEGWPHEVFNPLYSFVVGIGLSPDVNFDDLVNRFFLINKTLKRHEVVRALCVLGSGTVSWAIRDQRTNQTKVAMFRSDYGEPLIPAFFRSAKIGSAFHVLVVDLLQQLYNSILSPEDLAAKYGLTEYPVSIPKDKTVCLPPCNPPVAFDPETPESS